MLRGLDRSVSSRANNQALLWWKGRAALLEYRDIYAGGRLVGSASPDVITIINPATEEIVGAVPSAVSVDVDRAVRSARRAFDDGTWATCPPGGPGRRPRPAGGRPRGAHRGGGPARDGRDGDADRRLPAAQRRRAVRHPALLREPRPRHGHRGDQHRGLLHRPHRRAPRAGRRRGGHRQLELPAHAGVQPARPGARGRVHDRAQARRGHLAVRLHPGRGVRGRRLPARRVQPGHRHAPDGQRARPPSRRGHRVLLRADQAGPVDRLHLRRRAQARAPGARRPVRRDRARRRGPRKAGDALGRLIFGNSGQTCFAMSRVLVPEQRYGDLVDALAAQAGECASATR